MNSVMERWIGSCRRELLRQDLDLEPASPDDDAAGDADFYNTHRPHRTLKQAAPLRPLPNGVTDLDHFRVQRRDRVGGVTVGAENLCHLAGCSADRWLLGPRRLPGRGMIFGLWG